MPRFGFDGGGFGDLSGVPLERIEAEMCALAAHVEAGICRWLLLVAEFDRRGGAESWGLVSTAAWLAWRCAISPRTARDYVRVARALPGLPSTVAAFGSGELSYCKVRALTRIATAGTEAELIDFARAATTAQLELAVRTYRRCESQSLAEALGRHRDRRVEEYADETGMGCVDARLAPEEAAIVAKALDAAVAALEREEDDGEGPFSDAHAGCAGPGGECAAAGEDGGGSREPQNGGVGAAVGAGTQGGSREPQTGGVERPSWGQRRADALVLLARAFLASPVVPSGDDRYLVVVHADVDVVTAERDEEWARCHLEQGAPLAAATVRRLLCDQPTAALLEDRDGNPLFMGRKTRFANRAQRRAVGAREHGRCIWPGCGRTLRHVHHVREWAAEEGPTDIDQLAGLCRFHHRFVHEGGGRIERDAEANRFRFFTAAGVEVEAAPRAMGAPAATGQWAASVLSVEEANRAAGVAVADAPAPGDGEHLNLDLTMAGLFSLFDQERRHEQQRQHAES